MSEENLSEPMIGAPRTIRVNGDVLSGKDALHETFARLFRFPEYYGRNMDSWIDCMSDPNLLTDAAVHNESEAVVSDTITIKIENYGHLKEAAPQQWIDLIECSAFVNNRFIESGSNRRIALAFHG